MDPAFSANSKDLWPGFKPGHAVEEFRNGGGKWTKAGGGVEDEDSDFSRED